MSKDKLTEYDATASNNTDVGGISIAEGMLPSAVNNAIREQMSHLKEALGSGTPLYVDQTNNRVGIGTASPDVLLDIEGASATQHINATSGNANTFYQLAGTTTGSIEVGGGNSVYLTANNASGNMYFRTGGANTRMTVDSSGNLLIGTTGTTPVQSNTAGAFCYRPTAALEINGNNTQAALFGRTTDGEVLGFYSAGGKEGSISISGTTVSYNGGHLARWSQATDGNRIDGLVKGTVMTNLDQMAKWHHEAKAATFYEDDDEIPEGKKVGDEKTSAVAAYDEENEQLNCMAVSSVEGDANVAGVFVSWDDDDTDHTADMNVAMTGDMVIRIAKDTTVARGDLLMSAGDGTAKPQDDDIVRSKTIAKVTSTTKSHTYDDGSYLMPCVLMAC